MNWLATYETVTINGLQKSAELFSPGMFKGSSLIGSGLGIKGTKEKSTPLPTINEAQQRALGAVSDFVTPRIGTGATPFPDQLTADVPDLVGQAFDRFANQDRSLSTEERESLSGLATGQSFFDSDPEQIIQDWREKFANPLTSYYNEFVRPEVREEFNVPGGFNTSERAEGVSRSFNEFFGSQVAPTLFQAQENERQRAFAAQSQASQQQLPALQFSQNLPSLELSQAFGASAGRQAFDQPELTARYNEFLRTALENDPFTRIATGFSTTPTQDTVFQPAVSQLDKTLAFAGTVAQAAAAGA